MRAKKVTSEVGCKLTSASEISLDESQSTASQSPQPATTMSNEDPKSDYMMGKMLPAGRSSPSSPRQAPLQQFCTPPPSETESFGDPKSPIRCESPRQTSGDEDSKFDDKTMHKMLPQGEALIAHGQDSLPKQSCASLSSSESSDESESIKNLLPRQATDNPSDLLSRSRHTLARQDSLQQQSCASPENSDLIKKEATHNPSNLLSRSRYALASLSRPLVYDHEVRL